MGYASLTARIQLQNVVLATGITDAFVVRNGSFFMRVGLSLCR